MTPQVGTPQAASTATYNVNNQLTQWKGASLTYDANGNLTSDAPFASRMMFRDGTNTYTWNARNQLLSISGGVTANFQYDPFGRRVSKTIVGTTQYLYDGANPVQEISGTSASANLLTGGVDEYFQQTDSAGARNFLTDSLGSTLALTDSTGTVQTSYTFEPFGNTTTTGAATTNSFAYTGREVDPTGLYFYRARYYHPQLQRFIGEDPIGFGGGINKYAYAGNDPLDYIDPLGADKNKKDFGKCLKQNAHLYSAVGVFDLVAGTDFSETTVGNIIGGNDVTGLAFVFVGDPENAPESIGAVVANTVERGIPLGAGNPLLVGGQVNGGAYIQDFLGWSKTGKLYAGGPGRPEQVLRRTGLTKALKIAKVLGEAKEILDLGLAGALAVDCWLGVI